MGEGAKRQAVLLPALLVMRLRNLLRGATTKPVTDRMVEREVERRLRLTLGIDEEMEKWR